MALWFADSFDFYHVVGDMTAQQGSGNFIWDFCNGSPAFSSTTRFTTGQSVGWTGSSGGSTGITLATKNSPSLNDATVTVVVAADYNATPLGSSGTGIGYVLLDGTTSQCGIWFENDGAIRLRAGGLISGTVLATYTGAFAAQTWEQFQIAVTINSTTGAVHIRRNGNTSDDFAATGLNTQASSNAYANKVSVVGGGSQSFLFDDFMIFGGSGAAPNTWVGDIRAVQLTPALDPATNTFTPSGTISFIGWQGTGFTYNGSANQMASFVVSVTKASGISQIVLKLNAGITGSIACALYADNGSDAPGALLAQTNIIVNPATGLNTFTLTTPQILQPNVNYWLTVWTSSAFASPNLNSARGGTVATTFTGTFPSTCPITSLSNIGTPFFYAPLGNYTMIYEFLEDGDTTYVESQTSGDEDLYGNSQLTSTPASIPLVVAKMFCRKDNSGARSGAIQVKSGATEVNGTSTVLGSTYGWLTQVMATDPNTSSAWTETGVNNLLVGPKVTA